ncbi:MAG: hypothetical protein PWP08_1787 [Methanofollis sp.]|nr:hypothetical protein [Methanofollis sp.]
MMRAFMERLLFPNLAYTGPPQSLFDRKILSAFTYTMNASEPQMKEQQYPVHIAGGIPGCYP